MLGELGLVGGLVLKSPRGALPLGGRPAHAGRGAASGPKLHLLTAPSAVSQGWAPAGGRVRCGPLTKAQQLQHMARGGPPGGTLSRGSGLCVQISACRASAAVFGVRPQGKGLSCVLVPEDTLSKMSPVLHTCTLFPGTAQHARAQSEPWCPCRAAPTKRPRP